MAQHDTNAAVQSTPYDVAEHLRTPADMAAYLDAWLTEARYDAIGTAKAIADIARAKAARLAAADANPSDVQ